jgi:hypothetical protein
MRRLRLLAALTILGVGLVGVGVAHASENSAPLVEAGLDQQVEQNTTVYLDAGGSLDPDGSVTSYRWEITAPDGSTTAPDCPTCSLTQFRPSRAGQYNVTVAVTDDDGATTRDTLYVTVEPSNPPEVTLSGPTSVPAGESPNYSASASAGDAALSSLIWRVDGTHHASAFVSGDAASRTRTLSLGSGSHNVSVTAIDRDGKRWTDSLSVSVVAAPSETGGGSGGGSGSSGDGSAAQPLITYNLDGKGEFNVYQDEAATSSGTVDVDGVQISTSQIATMSDGNVIGYFEDKGVSEADLVDAAAQSSDETEYECTVGTCSLGTVGTYTTDTGASGDYDVIEGDGSHSGIGAGDETGSTRQDLGGWGGSSGGSDDATGGTGDIDWLFGGDSGDSGGSSDSGSSDSSDSDSGGDSSNSGGNSGSGGSSGGGDSDDGGGSRGWIGL